MNQQTIFVLGALISAAPSNEPAIVETDPKPFELLQPRPKHIGLDGWPLTLRRRFVKQAKGLWKGAKPTGILCHSAKAKQIALAN